MRLYATTQSERGKPVGKGANNHLRTEYQIERKDGTRPIVMIATIRLEDGRYVYDLKTPHGDEIITHEIEY